MDKNILKNLRGAMLPLSIIFSTFFSFAQESAPGLMLSAEQAVDMAMKNNHAIKSLEHQLKGSNYAVKSAATAFLPRANLNGKYTRKSGNDLFSKFLHSDLRNTYSYGVEIQQPIFTGFATLNALRSAITGEKLQEASTEKTRQTMRYAVLQIYWGLVNLEKSGNVAQEAVRQLEELEASQAAMLEEGMTTEHDHLLVEASLAQARFNVLEVESAVSSMKRQFALLLGLPPDTAIILTDTTASTAISFTADKDSSVNAAMRNRPDLREADLQLKLSEISVKLTRASLFPTLAAGYSWTNSRPDQMLQDKWGDDWYAYAVLNFNLFDWGDRFFKIKKAREQYLSLKELAEQKRDMVEKEAIDAYEHFIRCSKELDVAAILVNAREKAYEASLAKYEEGVMPLYELLNAQSSLLGAKYQLLKATTDLELAVVNLEMGGLGSSTQQTGQ